MWAADTTSRFGSWRCLLPKLLGSTWNWFLMRQNRTAHQGSSWISVASRNWAGNQGLAWKMEFGIPINGFYGISKLPIMVYEPRDGTGSTRAEPESRTATPPVASADSASALKEHFVSHSAAGHDVFARIWRLVISFQGRMSSVAGKLQFRSE